MFLPKSAISCMRSEGFSSLQNLCMVGEAAARNPITDAAPHFGFRPSARLVPPAISAIPLAITAASGLEMSLDLA